MIKNRKHGHLGLAVTDVKKAADWYIEVLGFELIGDFQAPNGDPVKFIKNNDITYEIYPLEKGAPKGAAGKIDHYSFSSDNIEEDYKFCKSQGYTITTNGIEEIPTFWEKGVRYFKIASTTGEQIEFCQIL